MQKDIKNRESFVKELFKLGAHFGFSRARRHPSVNSYLFGYKNKTTIIDLEKTIDSLESAKEFVAKLASEGKQILFVGTKDEAKSLISKYAAAINMPYVSERWIGGTFTNFKQIRNRVEKLKDYREKEKAGELSVYTKKERSVMAIEMEKMDRIFSGIEVMEKIPAAVFVLDVKEEHLAVAECRQLKLPVISLSSSDCDIRGIEYPIVANDTSRATIDYVLGEIASAYKDGKVAAQTAAPVAETKTV